MLGQDFVRDGCTILTHGYSRVVVSLLKLAASNGKRFSVICTGILSVVGFSPIGRAELPRSQFVMKVVSKLRL